MGARGGRSRLRLGPRGSRLGPPADARRPPPAARWARGARSLPCADPGGPAEAGRAAGQVRARPAPGLLGLARGEGKRSAAESGRLRVPAGLRRGGRAGRTGADARSLRPSSELSPGPSQAASCFGVPETLRGLAQVAEVRLRALPSRYTHHSHPRVRPGPETPFSPLKSLGDLRARGGRKESCSSLSKRVM